MLKLVLGSVISSNAHQLAYYIFATLPLPGSDDGPVRVRVDLILQNALSS